MSKENSVSENSKGSFKFSADKTYDLIKIEVVQKIKEEIISWAKRKFSFIIIVLNIIIIAMGFFGANLIIKESIRDTVKNELGEIKEEIADAMKATVLANNATEQAYRAIEKVNKKTKTYEDLVKLLSEDANKVSTQFGTIKDKIVLENNNVRSRIELDKKQFESRINELEKLVSQISSDTKKNREAYAAYKKELEIVRKKSEKELALFIENSKYTVNIFFYPFYSIQVEMAVSLLRRQGFKVNSESSQWPMEYRFDYLLKRWDVKDLPKTKTIFFYDDPDDKFIVDKVEEIRKLIQSIPAMDNFAIRKYSQVPSQVMTSMIASNVLWGFAKFVDIYIPNPKG